MTLWMPESQRYKFAGWLGNGIGQRPHGGDHKLTDLRKLCVPESGLVERR
jgi:hypothetical protein